MTQSFRILGNRTGEQRGRTRVDEENTRNGKFTGFHSGNLCHERNDACNLARCDGLIDGSFNIGNFCQQSQIHLASPTAV